MSAVARGSVIEAGGGDVDPLALVLGLGAAASLAARRRTPVLTLAVSGSLVLILMRVDADAGVVAVLAPAVALYSLAVTRGRLVRLAAAAAAVAAVVMAEVLHAGRPTLLQTLGHVLLVAIPLLAADAHRTRVAYVGLLRERLELAERTREQEAERRAPRGPGRAARGMRSGPART